MKLHRYGLFLPLISSTVIYRLPLHGVPSGITYTVGITIGFPPYDVNEPDRSKSNTFQLLLDTGSSNTAVTTPSCCTSSVLYTCINTCVKSTVKVSVQYVVGEWKGNIVSDSFSSSELKIHKDIQFAEIITQSDFIQSGFQGILGIAYPALAQPSKDPPHTLLSALVERNQVNNVFGLLLCGTLQQLLTSSTISPLSGYWRGITDQDGRAYSTQLLNTPIALEKWFVIIVTSMGFGNTLFSIDCEVYNDPQAIIDSGTSNIVLNSVVYTQVIARIRKEVFLLIPNFNPRYLNDGVPCCETYCTTDDINAPLLQLSSITVSFAYEDDTSRSQFTVSIPPQYYWRPIVFKGTKGSLTSCRLFGISEGTGTIFGNAFMDGLYIVHDLENQNMGIGVATNCPSGIISQKTISKIESFPIPDKTWCSCLSRSLRTSSLLRSYWPGKTRCFFWFWWMYVVIIAFCIVVLCCIYILYITILLYIRKRKRRQVRLAARDSSQSSLLNAIHPGTIAVLPNTEEPPASNDQVQVPALL